MNSNCYSNVSYYSPEPVSYTHLSPQAPHRPSKPAAFLPHPFSHIPIQEYNCHKYNPEAVHSLSLIHIYRRHSTLTVDTVSWHIQSLPDMHRRLSFPYSSPQKLETTARINAIPTSQMQRKNPEISPVVPPKYFIAI